MRVLEPDLKGKDTSDLWVFEAPLAALDLREVGPGKGGHKGSPWDTLVAWTRLLVLGIESSRWIWQIFRRWD